MIKQQVAKKAEEQEHQSAFQDTSNRFAVDQLLRNHGYRIYQRRAKREAIWLREGVQYRQQEALLRISKFQVSDALLKDQGFWEQYQ